jgi:Lar family restriction alleviation protein
MTELLDCPFCGEEAFVFTHYDGYSVRCANMACPSNGAYFETMEEAIEAWNARASREGEEKWST